jgi:toxin ParE1/3/4
MSGPELALEVSPQAEQDLAEIQAYTLAYWGIDRTQVYEAELFSCMALIQANPHLGKSSDRLGASVRILRIRQHRIVYRLTGDAIRVLRVLHFRRRIGRSTIEH